MSFFFTISEGLKGLKKTRLPSTLSIISILMANILAGIFLTLALNLNQFIGSIREKIEMEVFISQSVDENQIKDIGSKLENIEGIESLQYISKDDAAGRFKKEFGEDVMEILEYNPFPSSFVLIIASDYRNYQKISQINQEIAIIDGVDDVVYQKALLETVDKYVNFIFFIGIFIAIVIFTIGVVLIYNTIRLTVYARREAIHIMRLVGATSGFIRKPFIVEGILQGLIGSLSAVLILYYAIKIVKYFFYPYLVFQNELLIVFIVVGIIIGLLSARLSVSKHLKKI